MVIIVAPHTSWKDLFIGFAVRSKLKIEDANFFEKKNCLTVRLVGCFVDWGIQVDKRRKPGFGLHHLKAAE